MKRKLWKQIAIGVVGGLFAAVALASYIPKQTATNDSPDITKRHAMIRLEDVGLGGDYNTLEGLGKLRAVMTYLESEHIPFHMAVIPRRMSQNTDGVWKERGIDDPNPDPIVSAFISLLKEAEQHGGVLGMHGYRHQYGEAYREDGEQNSGTGSEFNIKGAPETQELSYASERMKDSLAAFEKAGLQPAFWESPHYQDTHEQEEVFRSYVGLMYQPDIYTKEARDDLNTYDTINTFGQNSLGSVYIPAPFRYVSDANSVDEMLERAKKEDGLASFYFHPFLEFKHLEPVLGADGNPTEENGLPVYQYKEEKGSSYLHTLVAGFKELNYRWMSLYDIVPFTPSHRVTLPPRTLLSGVLLGDVTGQGHADVVVRQAHRILVIPGSYTGPRNRTQEASQIWLKEEFAPEEQTLLVDLNGDGKQDLIAYNEQTGNVRVAWADKQHFRSPEVVGTLPAGLHTLQGLQTAEGRGLVGKTNKSIVQASVQNKRLVYTDIPVNLPEDAELFVGRFKDSAVDDIASLSRSTNKVSILYHQGNDRFAAPESVSGLSIGAGEQLLVGDPDGDGQSDLILYTAETGIWRVFENKGENHFQPLDNEFGPWAHGTGRHGVVADFDGNKKTDIGSYDETEHVLDLALSYRGGTPSP